MRKYSLLLLGLISGLLSAQVPDGYYNAAIGQKDTLLKTNLHQIIKVGTRLSYGSGSGATWSGFERTDLHPDGYVWDMYSLNQVTFPGNGSAASGMNIEHSFAKSWWGSTKNDAYKDLYHLNPSNSQANSARGSYPLGIVNGDGTFNNGSIKVGTNSSSADYTGQCFEPLDEYKGDFARAYFYMVTCYQDLTFQGNALTAINASDTYQAFKPWFRDLLLAWHRADPVSQKEISRLSAIYDIQNNRNPFIDYPCLVEYIWGNKQGETVDFSTMMSTASDEYLLADDKSGCDCRITVPTITKPTKNSTVSVGAANLNELVTASVEIKGVLLTENVSLQLSGANAAFFTISAATLSATDVMAGAAINISYLPTTLGTHTATLTISSSELSAPTSVTLSASCLATLVSPASTDLYFSSTDATEVQNMTLDIKGTNLSQPLTLSLQNDAAAHFQLSQTQISAADAMNGTQVTLLYSPNSLGTHSAQLLMSSSDFDTKTISVKGECQFDVMAPTAIEETSFTANWTNAAVSGYTLNVYSKEVTGIQENTIFSIDALSTTEVSANSYLSVSGKVYDESGSLRLGTGSGDGTLQIDADCSVGGTLILTAKYYSSDNSTLVVEAGGVDIETISLTNAFAEYQISIPVNTTGAITLSQGISGKRVMISAIKLITGGELITNTSVSGFPLELGNVQSYAVSGLSEGTVYFYTVTPQGAVVSDEMEVYLLGATNTLTPNTSNVTCYISADMLQIDNLPEHAELMLWDAMGRCLYRNAASYQAAIPLQNKGVYLLQIVADGQTNFVKLLK